MEEEELDGIEEHIQEYGDVDDNGDEFLAEEAEPVILR
jgi:hypothetical protein